MNIYLYSKTKLQCFDVKKNGTKLDFSKSLSVGIWAWLEFMSFIFRVYSLWCLSSHIPAIMLMANNGFTRWKVKLFCQTSSCWGSKVETEGTFSINTEVFGKQTSSLTVCFHVWQWVLWSVENGGKADLQLIFKRNTAVISSYFMLFKTAERSLNRSEALKAWETAHKSRKSCDFWSEPNISNWQQWWNHKEKEKTKTK